MVKADSPQVPHPPDSILVIGAGVFGISTTLALLNSDHYSRTKITVVDAYAPDLVPSNQHTCSGLPGRKEFTASLDSSRIIRPDYPNALYAQLADEATGLFRSGWAEGIDAPERTYTQPGLVLISSGPVDGRGRIFVHKTYENILNLARSARSLQKQTQTQTQTWSTGNTGTEPIQLPTSHDVEKLLSCNPGCLPEVTTGYINPQAGWANATAAISTVKARVLSLGRAREAQGNAPFQFMGNSKVSSLLFSDDKTRVIGAKLSNGEHIQATTTVLATGAWTASLLPSLLSPRLRATGQVLAYIPLDSAEEVSRYAGRPTVLDLETGMFAIFPPKHYIDEARQKGHVKIARHGWGYSYSLNVTDPITSHEVECCLPVENQDDFFKLPPEGRDACKQFARLLLPELSELENNFERICWYTDTPTGDFLIDFIPNLGGILVATGGSGHGFKFLPVIGEKVIARLEGRLDSGFADLWRWRGIEECERLWNGEGDTSRGGRRGLIWNEEIKGNNL